MGLIDKSVTAYRQQQILHCIWALGGEATIPQLSSKLEELYDVKLSCQGLNTMMLLLVDKGLVCKNGKIHQAFRYKTTLTREEFLTQEIARIRDLTFQGDSIALVSAFLQTHPSETDMTQIRGMVDSYQA